MRRNVRKTWIPQDSELRQTLSFSRLSDSLSTSFIQFEMPKLPHLMLLGTFLVSACAPINAPDPRTPNIPPPAAADARRTAVNEGNEPLKIIPLEEDVLVPTFSNDDPIPGGLIGPLEFRGETVANALELVLGDMNIPIAFETNEGLRRRITISNLSGTVDKVVERVCSLGNLYCAYDDGVMVVRDVQTFTVAMPPVGGDEAISNIASGLGAITGLEVSSDSTTNTLIYTATQRTAKLAEQYFARLRAATAMIIYETYIWEVLLNSDNGQGIDWQELGNVGKFNIGFNLAGSTPSNISGTPISIGLPTTDAVNFAAGDVFRFLSEQGAVKTISQPQITVLSGSEARLRVAETQNYISEIARTTDDNGDETVSTEVAQVDSGFALVIDSRWDQSTVYGNIQIQLDEFLGFQDFSTGTGTNATTLQLPRTSTREVETSVRVRPGDAVLIAGLVREQDSFSKAGLGYNNPIIPSSRGTSTDNTELVFLLRPRVIVYKPLDKKVVDEALKSLPQDLTPFVYDPSSAPQSEQLPIEAIDPAGVTPIKKPLPAPVVIDDKDWSK